MVGTPLVGVHKRPSCNVNIVYHVNVVNSYLLLTGCSHNRVMFGWCAGFVEIPSF